MPACGQQRGEDAVARREGEGAALPHRELAGPGQPQGGAGRAGDPQRVDRLGVVEAQELGGGQGRRERAVGGVVPAPGADAGGVAEAALDLVGDRRRGDPGPAVGPGVLAGRHDRRPVVARVGRLEREVRVVAVEVADVHAVGERRPVGRRPAPAEQGRAAARPAPSARPAARSSAPARPGRPRRRRRRRAAAAGPRRRRPRAGPRTGSRARNAARRSARVSGIIRPRHVRVDPHHNDDVGPRDSRSDRRGPRADLRRTSDRDATWTGGSWPALALTGDAPAPRECLQTGIRLHLPRPCRPRNRSG